jgi:hypothetical protein
MAALMTSEAGRMCLEDKMNPSLAKEAPRQTTLSDQRGQNALQRSHYRELCILSKALSV